MNMMNYLHVVAKIRDTWWNSLKDHFRDIQKNKSGDAGESKSAKTITWIFYQEMSFMKPFIYTRQYKI